MMMHRRAAVVAAASAGRAASAAAAASGGESSSSSCLLRKNRRRRPLPTVVGVRASSSFSSSSSRRWQSIATGRRPIVPGASSLSSSSMGSVDDASGRRSSGASAMPRAAGFLPARAAVGCGFGTTTATTPRHRRRRDAAPAHARGLSTLALATRIWDMVEGRSLNPANPVLEDVKRLFLSNESDVNSAKEEEGWKEDKDSSDSATTPNFARYRPHHLAEAADKIQEEYDAALEEFELDLSASSGDGGGAVSYDDVVLRLDNLSAPLRHVGILAQLFRTCRNDEETESALADFAGARFDHEQSEVVARALRRLHRNLVEGSGGKEHTNAAKGLAEEYERRGMFLEDDADRRALAEVDARLREAEADFLVLAHYDEVVERPPSPKECLASMYEILALQNTRAKLLGYESYADWSLEPTMAGSVGAVRALHGAIADRVLPEMTEELLAEYDRIDAEIGDLREYFPLESVLEGTFALTRTLFGIAVEEEAGDGAANGWHRDVRLFRVYDEGSGDLLGSFYLDPFRRRGSKRAGNFAMPLMFRNKHDNIKPLVALSLSVVPPAWDTDPAHLTFDDVESLLHEFGHVLQFLLADVERGSLSGDQRLPYDASEFVSQFMEYWLYEDDVLPQFSRGPNNGQSLPPDTVRKLQERRVLQKKIDLCRHLFRSEVELAVHSQFTEPPFDESLVAVQKRMAATYISHEGPLGKGDISPLMEIFAANASGGGGAGGVETCCHRYVWSDVLSADAFAAFREAGGAFGGGSSGEGDGGKDREAARRSVGMAFRRSILDAGATASSVREAYEAFRGREATPRALLDYLRL